MEAYREDVAAFNANLEEFSRGFKDNLNPTILNEKVNEILKSISKMDKKTDAKISSCSEDWHKINIAIEEIIKQLKKSSAASQDDEKTTAILEHFNTLSVKKTKKLDKTMLIDVW